VSQCERESITLARWVFVGDVVSTASTDVILRRQNCLPHPPASADNRPGRLDRKTGHRFAEYAPMGRGDFKRVDRPCRGCCPGARWPTRSQISDGAQRRDQCGKGISSFELTVIILANSFLGHCQLFVVAHPSSCLPFQVEQVSRPAQLTITNVGDQTRYSNRVLDLRVSSQNAP